MADSASSKSTFNLTPREQEVVVVALKNLKGGEISIDYEGMAAGLGLKDKASARASWCSVKKKLFGEPGSPAASSDVPATPAKAKTPRKTKDPNAPSAPKSTKKAAKSAVTVSDDATDGAEVPDNGDASVEVATPSTPPTVTPKKRGRKSKAEKDAEAAAAKDSALDGDDQEDNKPVKKARKTPVKKSAAVAKTDGTNVANDDTGTKEAPPSEEAKKAKRAEQDACAAEANEVLTGKKEVTPTDTSSEADASDSAKQSTTPEGQAEIVIDDDDSA